MNKREIQTAINSELAVLKLDDSFYHKLQNRQNKNQIKKPYRTLAAAVTFCFILCSTTVLAAYYIHNKINVNDYTLPELAPMAIVAPQTIPGSVDEYGILEKTYSSYDTLATELQIPLLDSDLAKEHSQMQAKLTTNNQDYMMIQVENYILGDIKQLKPLPEGSDYGYQYDHDNIYYSPITLELDLILSKEQMDIGLEKDYLGYYEFIESYTSTQGYQVNLSQTNTDPATTQDDIINKKYAIFVADGIRYTLSGQVSLETMKTIVDTMTYPSATTK